MEELYVIYEEDRKSLNEDEDDRRYTIDVKVIGLCTKEPDSLYYSSVEARGFAPEVGDKVFLLVVRHSDGDTFSSSSGHAYFEGVYLSMNDAAKIAKSIRNNTYTNDKYTPWLDWASSLEDIEIHSMTIKESVVDGNGVFKLINHD